MTPKKAGKLSGPEYLSLAYRSVFYRGVMRGRVQAEMEDEEQGPKPRSEREDVTWVDGSLESLQTNPAFRGAISFGRADGVGL